MTLPDMFQTVVDGAAAGVRLHHHAGEKLPGAGIADAVAEDLETVAA